MRLFFVAPCATPRRGRGGIVSVRDAFKIGAGMAIGGSVPSFRMPLAGIQAKIRSGPDQNVRGRRLAIRQRLSCEESFSGV
jgi:hypothetical protein